MQDKKLKKIYDKCRQCTKGRDVILSTKVHMIKAVVSPVALYKCECWTIRKAKHRRTDAFKLGCGWTPLVAQRVKYLPAMWEAWV